MRRLLLLFSLILTTSSALAERPLVAEISSHDITIHSAFDGTELILFGVRNQPGDIIVVVRGPAKKATIRKKENVMGIWINRTFEKFYNVPAFYAMASSRPYELIPKSIYFDALQVGYEEAIHPFRLARAEVLSEDERARREIFARALLRDMRSHALYGTDIAKVNFIGGGLFKTTIVFPDNTPTGIYSAEVYLFSDGQISGMHATPIYVYKSGFDALIYNLAHEHPVIYGLVAIILGISGGLAAIWLFSRRT